MNLRSFFGILPPKLPYADVATPVERLAMPEKLTLLWRECTTSDIAPRVGEQVRTGQNLARKRRGFFVSTTAGRIDEIRAFKGPEGGNDVAVVIRPESSDLTDHPLKVVEDFSRAEPEELRAAINRFGSAALSSISPDPSAWPQVEALVVSALDQDLHCVANQEAFRTHADQLGAAIQMLVRATGASRSVLAVPRNLADSGRSVTAGPATVVSVPPLYPNGLPEILARQYGAGRLMKITYAGLIGNTLVVSVEHAVAMLAGLQSGRPLMEKTVTVSAGRNGQLRNYRVRIGTPIGYILQEAGLTVQPKGKLILNGTMSGYTCFSDEQPVTAGTDSVHVQSPSEVFFFENTQCTNCGKCNAICPVDLEANFLGRLSEYSIFDKCRGLGAENCIECGLCAYVCPARRPLVHLIAHAKRAIRTEALEEVSAEEAVACEACGPSPPAIRIFGTSPEEETSAGREQDT